jgi:hypothetical protein
MTWGLRRPWNKGGEEPEITPASLVPSTSNSSGGEKSSQLKTTISPSNQDITAPERLDIPKFEKSHQFDPNLPQSKIDALHAAAQTGDAEAVHEIEVTFAEDSPYEEVRAAVRNEDGEEVANTVRAWILGMMFVTVGAGANMFLSMRSPAINFPAIVVQL